MVVLYTKTTYITLKYSGQVSLSIKDTTVHFSPRSQHNEINMAVRIKMPIVVVLCVTLNVMLL